MSVPINRVQLRTVVRFHYGSALKAGDRVEAGRYFVYGSNGPVGKHNNRLVESPTIIVGRKGSVGSLYYAPDGGWPIDTTYYTEILDSNRLHLRYLFHALQQAKLDRHTIVTSIPGLNRDSLYRTEIPIPYTDDPARSLREQKRIATILDKADAIRRKRQEIESEVAEVIGSQFLDVFGDPLRNPRRWPSGTFDDHLTLVQYGPRFFNEAYSAEGIRIVRITDLDFQGRLDYSAMPLMSVSEADKNNYGLRPGDLLLARSGATVGKTALIDDETPVCIAGAYFIRLRFSDAIRPLYAQMVLRSKPVQRIIAERSRQSAQQNFNGPAIRVLPLPVPPTDLQDDFVRFHRKALQAGKRLANATAQTHDLFNSLVQRAFKGEL